jgi:ergothioneine biosynthesis protein EgtB
VESEFVLNPHPIKLYFEYLSVKEMALDKTESSNGIQYVDDFNFDSDSRTHIVHENGGSDLNININNLINEFLQVRKQTLELFQPLTVEDAVIQSDSFGSPPNWHIAHVSWFFQKIIEKHKQGQEQTSSGDIGTINLRYLNSYYERYGNILPKTERGRFPRPTVDQTLKYRTYIEGKLISFLREIGKGLYELTRELEYDITLGNHHEMQHQELMIYDFQHYFNRFLNAEDNYVPVRAARPILRKEKTHKRKKSTDINSEMIPIEGGIYELGFNGKGFCYDNELPEHKIYLEPYKIDIKLVTNGDFLKFIEDGGYNNYQFWLADGWELIKDHGLKSPMYWKEERDGNRTYWIKKDFRGIHKLEMNEPVINVSYYEADAYARWAKKRLPTEAEWEKAASWNPDTQNKTLFPWGNEPPQPEHANLLESYQWGPSPAGSYPDGRSYYGCYQMIGDVWEWTSSEYVLYPGFKPKFSEYTDKWAINQKVMRGGSFATPANQVRNSYRNYFKPYERIPFSGFRCAADG